MFSMVVIIFQLYTSADIRQLIVVTDICMFQKVIIHTVSDIVIYFRGNIYHLQTYVTKYNNGYFWIKSTITYLLLIEVTLVPSNYNAEKLKVN